MSNEMKTIVILTPAFPANESESYWVPSQQLFVKALRKNFPELNIIVLSFLYPYHKSEYDWNEIKVNSFDGMHQRKLKRLLLLRTIWQTLKKIKKENNVIGIFSFWCRECALIGKWFGKWHKVKHLCWICGQDARKMNKMVKLIRPTSEELVAMSNFLVNEFEKNHGVRPAHVIHNAIDPQSFPPISVERDIDILGAGSFEPLKQYDVFTKIVKAIREKLHNIKAYHCGIGVEKEKIQSLIKELALENHFQLLGGKPHDELMILMQRTKVFLHPSLYEGFSTVCLEALYAGAHVVSFCDPMEGKIPHWHIVRTKEEMIEKTSEILQQPFTEYKPVLLHSMDDSVKAVMNLFGYRQKPAYNLSN
jgi:glycosyltransferase involved in cell wall biosynthesis